MEMKTYNLVLENFEAPVPKILKVKSVEISPKLDKICVLCHDDTVAIFATYNTLKPLWIGNDKLNSVRFSDSGDELVGITSTGSINVFRCHNRQIVEIGEKKLSQLLANVLAKADDLKPIAFAKKLLVLFCNNNCLVGLEWNEGEIWRRLYVTKTDPSIAVAVCEDSIYLLSNDGEILTYCVNNGHQTGQVSVKNAINSQGSVESSSFKTLAISSDHLAAADVNDHIYLFAKSDLLAQQEVDTKPTVDTEAVRKLSSSADQFPTSSKSANVFRGSESYPKRDALPDRMYCSGSGTLTWSPSVEEELEPTLDYALITQLEGFSIESMKFLPAGLSVWYTQSQGCGVYRVYNAETGVCMLEDSVPADTTVLLSGYLGTVDAFVSPTKLHIHLCGVSKEQIAMKVLKRVGVSNVGQVMQGPGWQDIDVALPVLSEGIACRQLDISRLAVKLYQEGFKHAINNTSYTRTIEMIIKNLKKLYSIIFTGIEDNLHTLNLAENLVAMSLNLCYDLLSVLYQRLEIDKSGNWFEVTEQELMKAVVKLRAYLYHPPQALQKEVVANVPAELEGLSPRVREMWELWHNLPEEEIIYQAIEHGFLPMAQTFFVTVKNKTKEQVVQDIKETVNSLVLKFLRDCQISQCQKILMNMGYNPMEKLKEIYLDTHEEQLQNFLFGFLSNHDILTKEEIDAGLFLRHLKQALAKNLSNWHGVKMLQDKLPMNVGFVVQHPSRWRDQVWVELALNSNDIELQCMMVPNAVWSYLLLTNQLDLLEMWTNQQFSNQPTTLSDDSTLNSKFIEGLKVLFGSWEITPMMVDMINTANCLKTTKEFLLDNLSKFGIFCSTEKSSLSNILSRFVRTGNVSNIEGILNHPAAVLTYQEFSRLLLKFCVQHRLGSVLFSCLAGTQDMTQLVSECDTSECNILWLQAWLDLVNLAEEPDTHMVKAIESSLNHLAEGDIDGYLKKRPYLILAHILLSQQPMSEILTKAPDQLDLPLTQELVEIAKKAMPILTQVTSTHAWNTNQNPDITLYELLEKSTVFDISKLFGWQENHKKKSDDIIPQLPHFSTGSLFEKFAYKEIINYEFYLKHGRPSYAYCVFVLEQYRYHKKLSKKRKKQACNIAHGLALCNFYDSRIVAACVSFIEMLGLNSEKARLHVNIGNLILQAPDCTHTKSQVGTLLQHLLYKRESAAVQLLSLLENALISLELNSSQLQPVQTWSIAIRFARVHSLPLPESLPIVYAKSNTWLQFVICLELYQYPLQQALQLVEKFSDKKIREHLLHAFSKTTERSTNLIPSKKESHLKLRDARKFLYSRIGLTAEERATDTSSDTSSVTESAATVVAKSWSSDSSSTPGLTTSTSCVLHLEHDSEVFSTLLACHASEDPPHALLNSSLAYSIPMFAVLASCYESCSLVACMGTWLVSSLCGSVRSEAELELTVSLQSHAWTAANVQSLWSLAVGAGYVSTINTALHIFLPDNPIFALTEFIRQCVIDKNFEESANNIQLFKTKCQNLPVAVNASEQGSFLKDRHWLYSVAVQLVCTALAKCFSSSFHQFRFLHILCQSAFSEYIPVEAPDFAHLQQLQECLLETGVQLDYSALCVERRGSERELQLCLDRLVTGGHFLQALKLARTAGLPRDAVVIAQWNNEIEKLKEPAEDGNEKFWSKCQAAFEEANIQATVAADFFQAHVETRQSVHEKYLVLCLSHKWYSAAKQQSARKRPDCYLTKAVEVELEMWRTRLNIEPTLVQAEASSPSKLFTYTRKDVMLDAGVGFIDMETQLEDPEQIKTLDAVISELLDHGKVAQAVRLEALFCHKNKDIQILLTCLSLAEGEIQPYQLSSEHRTMIEQTLAPSGSFRRRPLHSLRLSNHSYSKLEMSMSPPGSSLASEYVEIPPREQQDTLAAVEKLAERLQHGRTIGARIAACYRVSMNIDKSFVDIITMDDTLTLLKSAIAKDCLNKFAVASDLSSVDQISKEDMAQFLCEEIMSAVSKGHMQGGTCETGFVSAGGSMWGCDLDTSFHLVLELCPDPTLLAKNLMEIATHLNSTQPDAMKQVHVVVVELLIRAHDCFTSACDMEGIAQVLQKTRALTSNLLQLKEWQLMVRLVTGIGRYTDMSYIFQILKDHEQFEFLLGKGMDKVPGLKLALLEFVRSRCAQDRELLRLVALHFRLYSEVAELWEGEARATIHSLLNVTRLELSANKTATRVAPGTPSPKHIKASPDTAHLLKLAMQSFSHAAEYYLQANKLTKAMQSAHNAELVALQISLTQGVSNGQTVDCLLEQDTPQVSHLITNSLSFPQANIVAKAYSHPVDWGAALYQHCVVFREQKYMTDFMQAMILTPALVEDVARRFERESSVSKEMARMMKQLVSSVQCVEVKYRVASQLGFKDILEEMLAGADLPYLKDTVWRRGLQKRY